MFSLAKEAYVEITIYETCSVGESRSRVKIDAKSFFQRLFEQSVLSFYLYEVKSIITKKLFRFLSRNQG